MSVMSVVSCDVRDVVLGVFGIPYLWPFTFLFLFFVCSFHTYFVCWYMFILFRVIRPFSL